MTGQHQMALKDARIEVLERVAEDLKRINSNDSKELRRLCEARDLAYAARTRQQARAESLEKEMEVSRKAIRVMYDRWESGDDCYEDPYEHVGYLGKAVNFTDDELDLIEGVLSAPDKLDAKTTEAKP